MANAINISDQIRISQICQYLISGDNAKKKIFEGGVLTDKRPTLLRMTQMALSFGNTPYSGMKQLDAIATFNVKLCGEYYNIAKSLLGEWNPNIITSGTGTDGYTAITIMRDYPDFIVGAMGSPMANNQSVLVINDTEITPETSDGSIEIHIDGLKLSNAVAGITNYAVFYAPNSFTITFDPALTGDGDPLNSNRVSIKYPISKNFAVSVSGGGGSAYSERVEFGTNDTYVFELNTTRQGLLGQFPHFQVWQYRSGTSGIADIITIPIDEDDTGALKEFTFYLPGVPGFIIAAP